MTDFFDDDDSGFWEQRSEPTIQLDRVRRKSPERTRTHHVVERDATPTGAQRRTAAPTDHGATRPPDHFEDGSIDHDMIWVEPISRRRDRRASAGGRGMFGSIDPRLLSVGAIAVAAVLAVPLFGALGTGGDEDSFRSVVEAESTTTVAPASTVPPTTAVVITAALNPVPTDAVSPADDDGADEAGGAASSGAGFAGAAGSDHDDEGSSSGGGSNDSGGGAGLAAPAVRVAAQCGNPYEVAAGDYWLGIAAAIDVSVDELLDYNEATADTPIYPGSIVCLPLGTSVSPPTTEAPATSAAPTDPATTAAPVSTDPATTAAPATTEPATTQAPQTTEVATTQPSSNGNGGAGQDDEDDDSGGIPLPTASVPSGGAVEQMIRDIWPDDLEDQALRIAWRESNYRPDVTSSTGCCLGVFQIHWESHQSWLAELGITSREQLFDAATNIRAAYALYQRAGGWGAWQ